MAGESQSRIDPLLRAAAARLKADSDRVRALTDHAGEAGRGRELVLRQVLGGLLPRRFGLRSGSILGRDGLTTRQLDVMVCDLDNYPDFEYEPGAGLLLPAAVYGAISVKTYLRPSDVSTYFDEARAVKTLANHALGREWPGFCALFAYTATGSESALTDAYHEQIQQGHKRDGLDLIVALDRSPICLDATTFQDPKTFGPLAFIATRSHFLGIGLNACRVDSDLPFGDFYKLLLVALDRDRLDSLTTLGGVSLGAFAPDGLIGDPSFDAAFAGKSADLTLRPGQRGQFAMFYANVGTRSWSRAERTDARLAVAGPRGHVTRMWGLGWPADDRYALQVQESVDPGQIATFVFDVEVPRDAKPGHYRFFTRPIVEGIGPLAPETRANAVTVVIDSDVPRDGGREGEN